MDRVVHRVNEYTFSRKLHGGKGARCMRVHVDDGYMGVAHACVRVCGFKTRGYFKPSTVRTFGSGAREAPR